MDKEQRYNFKLRLVTTILAGEASIKGLARSENIPHSNIHFWLKLYQFYGEQGLLGISQRGFTIEEKTHIIMEHQNTGSS